MPFGSFALLRTPRWSAPTGRQGMRWTAEGESIQVPEAPGGFREHCSAPSQLSNPCLEALPKKSPPVVSADPGGSNGWSGQGSRNQPVVFGPRGANTPSTCKS
jgi:hypothetical protein